MKSVAFQKNEAWLNKIPEVTLIFWIIKMMSTTVGETAADFLNVNLHLGLSVTSLVIGILLVIALVFQFKQNRYIPTPYWVTVVFISVFGTLVTDNLTDNMHVPLEVSSGVFAVALIVTFALWYAKERTLSIHAVDSFKREAYYWMAIFFTFALGTAVGDLVAESLSLGYGVSALLFGGLIAAITFVYYGFKANATTCFWLAYVLTRPFGASCGDLLAQPISNGGLGLGVTGTSAVFLIVITLLVARLSSMQKSISANLNSRRRI